MENILKMLGIDKLDEEKQNEISQKLSEIIDVKAQEKLKEKETELKESLTEEFATKFEDYKNDITEKFSNFLDAVLDEEMQVPENIVEYARKGEMYDELIEAFKAKLAIDEGVLDEEVKNLLKECKDEITKLKNEMNGLIKENIETKSDAKEFAAKLYMIEKCEGLDLHTKEKVLSLLEGLNEKEQIDKKFDIVLEVVKDEKKKDDDDDDDDDGDLDDEEKKKKKKKEDDKENGKGTSESFVDEKELTGFDKMKTYWISQMNEDI